MEDLNFLPAERQSVVSILEICFCWVFFIYILFVLVHDFVCFVCKSLFLHWFCLILVGSSLFVLFFSWKSWLVCFFFFEFDLLDSYYMSLFVCLFPFLCFVWLSLLDCWFFFLFSLLFVRLFVDSHLQWKNKNIYSIYFIRFGFNIFMILCCSFG